MHLQVCLCPVTDWRFDTPSYVESWRYPVPDLHAAHMAWYRRRYLATGRPEDVNHPYAAPLRAADLDGVAPAVIVNASHDPLRSEGEAYAARLRNSSDGSGSSDGATPRLVRCTTYEGVMHDWYLRFQYEGVDEFWAHLAADIRRELGVVIAE